ncbi:unnamed protein product [Lactuca virosa]|uniref:Uncharacterized protein n=1 Tax=Lactuca virosa TaxID=75947 RepID=A0AAU9LVF2_9ASTR|nr:unnamed protein product [Lactuca virosa]
MHHRLHRLQYLHKLRLSISSLPITECKSSPLNPSSLINPKSLTVFASVKKIVVLLLRPAFISPCHSFSELTPFTIDFVADNPSSDATSSIAAGSADYFVKVANFFDSRLYASIRSLTVSRSD